MFDNLSKKQLSVFEQIAIGNDARHNKQTINSLKRLGLVEEYRESYINRIDRTGQTFIFRYRVPIAVHIEWCAWCSASGYGRI